MGTELFAGMQFYLTLDCNDKERIKCMIEANGGIVAPTFSSSVIQLLTEEKLNALKQMDHRILRIDFIADAVSHYVTHSARLPRTNYMYIPEDSAKKNVVVKRAFTREAEAKMMYYVNQQAAAGVHSASGLKFWKEAEAKKITNHPADSMRGRYRKKLRGENLSYTEHMVLVEYGRQLMEGGQAVREQDVSLVEGDAAIVNDNTTNENVSANVGAESPPVASTRKRARLPERNENAMQAPATTTLGNAMVEPVQVENTLTTNLREILQAAETQNTQQLSQTNTDKHIDLIQMCTSHSRNDIIHALYYSSGRPDVAISYLRGNVPDDYWFDTEDAEIVKLNNVSRLNLQKEAANLKNVSRHSVHQIVERLRFIKA